MNDNSQPVPEIEATNVDTNPEPGDGEGFVSGIGRNDIFDTYADLFFTQVSKIFGTTSDHWTARNLTLPGNGSLRLAITNLKRRKLIISGNSVNAVPLYLSAQNASVSGSGSISGENLLAVQPKFAVGLLYYFESSMEHTGEVWAINPNADSLEINLYEEYYK